MKKLVFLALVLSGCAGVVTREDFDTEGFNSDMKLRFMTDDRFCKTLSKDMRTKFGIASLPYAQCMYERGYRFKQKTDVSSD